MKELSLKEIKKIEFDLLCAFDSFCKKNNIKYFLSNGTLLGAIKYNGFIPWDDDVDVLVPRKDYDSLISLFKNDDKYQLFSYERDSKYRFPFAKLCDLTTVKKEGLVDNGADLGLDIDIFPIDEWNNDLKKAKKEAKYINRMMFCLSLTKLERSDSVNLLKRFAKRLLMIVCKKRGSEYFIKKIQKKSTEVNTGNSSYCGCKSWCIYGEREIIESAAFESTVDVEFEGRSFPAPVGYDTYLRSLYGDYEKDPPKEKQKTHHDFRAYLRSK